MIDWSPEVALADFREVARLAGVTLDAGAITLEKLPAPHVAPSGLPAGKMAVYVFSKPGVVLKVGKVGPKSQARYTSQHYNPGSAVSTLAASILSDRKYYSLSNDDDASVGLWIKNNVSRVNMLLDANVGLTTLALLEAFLQCRLNPRYEGFKSQRL